MGHSSASFACMVICILSTGTDAHNADVASTPGPQSSTTRPSNTPAVVPNGSNTTLDGSSNDQTDQYGALDQTLRLIGGLLNGLGGGDQNSLQQLMDPATTRRVLAAKGVSDACSDDMIKVIHGLKSLKPWAMNMIDAMGKPESNILHPYGSMWMGSYDECLGIEATGSDTNGTDVTYFTGQYCIVKMQMHGFPTVPSGRITAHQGVCAPNRCSSRDAHLVTEAVYHFLSAGKIAVWWVYCLEEREWTPEATAVTVVLAILGCLLVTGTLYDVIVMQLKWTGNDDTAPQPPAQLIGVRNQCFTVADGKGTTVEMESKHYNDTKSADTMPGDVDMGSVHVSPTNVSVRENVAYKNRERSLLGNILLAFSVYSNGKKILGTSQGAGRLGSIHGIRFLSMSLVILGHTYFYARFYAKDLTRHVKYGKIWHWTFMVVYYAVVSIDSFFCIGFVNFLFLSTHLRGILVAYATLRQLKKVGGPRKLNWFKFYFHRFWRLTPAYMFVLMTAYALLPYISDVTAGPFKPWPLMTKHCKENWWTNLLYINNFVHTDKECMGWSWYLANDMQFYIISPLIILPLFFNFAAGTVSCLVFMAATLITTGVVTRHHRYNAQMEVDDIHKPMDKNALQTIYYPSYTRIGPYIVGLFIGYLLYRWNCKLPDINGISDRVKKLVNVAMWLLCIGMCCVIVYAPLHDGTTNVFNPDGSAAYITLSKTAWGLAVGWIVLACACGYGGWINELLSWKAFIPLGRLTYCAYLVHPLVMDTYLRSLRAPYHFTDYTATYLFLANMVLSYGVAFVCSLAFESPMMALEKVILERGKWCRNCRPKK